MHFWSIRTEAFTAQFMTTIGSSLLGIGSVSCPQTDRHLALSGTSNSARLSTCRLNAKVMIFIFNNLGVDESDNVQLLAYQTPEKFLFGEDSARFGNRLPVEDGHGRARMPGLCN